jgi:hypothetical protein
LRFVSGSLLYGELKTLVTHMAADTVDCHGQLNQCFYTKKQNITKLL